MSFSKYFSGKGVLHLFLVVALLLVALFFVYFIGNFSSEKSVSLGGSERINPFAVRTSILQSDGAAVLGKDGRVVEVKGDFSKLITPYDFVLEEGDILREDGVIVFR